MVFYDLRIGSFNLKYTPLKPKAETYEDCDSEGNILKKVIDVKSVSHFEDEKGNKHDTAFKLIKGIPRAKLTKTKETDVYKEVDISEVENLIVEKEYLVYCDVLLKELQQTGKALKIGFTFGNGFKTYFAYIHTSKLYEGFLFMSCGTTQKSEVIQEIIETQKLKDKAKAVDLVVAGVDRAKVEDLIEL